MFTFAFRWPEGGLRRVPLLFLCAVLAISAEDPKVEIVAAYQRALDALRNGDAEGALAIDTDDWVSMTVGQAPRSKQEMAPLVRRDIASMKPPAGWAAVWRPDYEHNGTLSGIQIYEVKVDGDKAVVLCLVGNTREVDGHRVWTGSHVRDSWVRTAGGWKRRMHEKLTVNERMVDGRMVER